MSALGITVQDQAFDADTPIGKIHMVNLRATIPGTRPERVIIAGHYDTKRTGSSDSWARTTADRAARFSLKSPVC